MAADTNAVQQQEEMPEGGGGWAEQLMQHILKPGSSHSGLMLTILNSLFVVLVIITLAMIWFDPTDVHRYVFGALLTGLVASTNWFFSLVLSEDPAAREAKKED
eukprot:Hpha_TRINITY_DN20398_c0_g1::TRINITY_DN20398_c0_g1_i1::g.138079::m.138079